ncbi:MAG: hypothetical protein V3T86_04410, partial [Planctomycetota bacterium]
MKFRRLALLLIAALVVHADEADDGKEKKPVSPEERRVKRRLEIKARFTSLDKIVAQKLEDFALDPIRNWEAAEASLVREKVEGLHDPIRYYLLDIDWEVQAFVCYYAGRRGLVDLMPEIEEAYDEAKFAFIRRKAVEAAVAFAKGKRGAEAHEFLK